MSTIEMMGMGMELVNWYEASLPLRERKQRGHFSTPPQLVEQILDACGYCPENDLSSRRVLDPACGSGNFLAGAARRLAAFAARVGLCESEAAALVTRNLWGFDPDPVSCFLAEMNVRAQYQVCEDGEWRADKEPFRKSPATDPVGAQFIAPTADLSAHVDPEAEGADKSAVGAINRPLRDGLDVWKDGDVANKSGVFKGEDRGARLHIHQADGLAMAWEGYEGIDLFLANPPYLAAKNSDLSGYRSTHRGGQMDSYLLFLDLALAVVRPGGWLALVLPDPVLARANAGRQRARLLESCTIAHLWHLSGVFAASVGAVVLIAQKRPAPAKHLIFWQRAGWSRNVRQQAAADVKGRQDVQDRQSGEQKQHGETFNTVPQSLFQRQPGAELCYLLSSERGALIERLRACLEQANDSVHRLVPLSDFLTIKRGEELGRKSGLLVQTAASGYFPVLLGGVDVKPYGTPVGSCWLAGEAIEKPLARYLAPKLLVVKSTGQLQAALDVSGHVALQTLYVLHARVGGDSDDLYFFLALLNSQMLREYVYMLHTAYKWVQPQIEQHVLARLPVPLVSVEEKRALIERAKRLMEGLALLRQREVCSEAGAVVELKQRWQGLYEEQEREIDALYAAALD